MVIITTNELTRNPNKYFSMLPNEKVVVKRKNAFIELTYRGTELPEEVDDTLMSKEEFFAMVDKAKEEYLNGEYIEYTPELRKKWFGNV